MSKKIIAFDLETIANKAMIDILPEVKPNSRLKDPAKIATDIAEKEKKQIMEMGLEPTMNMICAAGFYDENGASSIMLQEESPEAEKELLIKLWEKLSGYDVFVGFNSKSFDLRCILLHGMEHEIRPSVNIDKQKYHRVGTNHIDLRAILAGEGQFAKGKLDFFCKKYLRMGKKEGIDGALVQSYWDMSLVDDIQMYVEDDAKLTFGLYVKAVIAGLLE